MIIRLAVANEANLLPQASSTHRCMALERRIQNLRLSNSLSSVSLNSLSSVRRKWLALDGGYQPPIKAPDSL